RFRLEAGAQQRTGIVGHALQPDLVGKTALALLRRFLRLAGLGTRLLLPFALLFAQCLLHALALRGIGLRLLPGVVRRVGLRGRLLAFLRPPVLPVGLAGIVLRLLLALLPLLLALLVFARLPTRAVLPLRQVLVLLLVLLPVLLLLLLVLLLLLLVLLLLLLPLARRVRRIPVVDGVTHARLQLQRAVVGGDRVIEASRLRQRVAEVVLAVGIGQRRET